MGTSDFTSPKMRVLFVCLLVTLAALTCGKTTVKKNESDKKSGNVEDRGDILDGLSPISLICSVYYPTFFNCPYYDEAVNTINANSTATEEVIPPTRDGEDVEQVVPEEETDKNKRKKNKKNKKKNKNGGKNKRKGNKKNEKKNQKNKNNNKENRKNKQS